MLSTTQIGTFGECCAGDHHWTTSQHIGRINNGDRVRLVYADLRDTMAVQNAVIESKPDIVFHLAAQSYPRTSFDSPLDTLDTNIQGTERLLGALRKYAKGAVVHVLRVLKFLGACPREASNQ